MLIWEQLHLYESFSDGAPGSQNGFDNSGQKLPYPRWQSKPENVARTTAVIKQLGTT